MKKLVSSKITQLRDLVTSGYDHFEKAGKIVSYLVHVERLTLLTIATACNDSSLFTVGFIRMLCRIGDGKMPASFMFNRGSVRQALVELTDVHMAKLKTDNYKIKVYMPGTTVIRTYEVQSLPTKIINQVFRKIDSGNEREIRTVEEQKLWFDSQKKAVAGTKRMWKIAANKLVILTNPKVTFTKRQLQAIIAKMV